MKVFLFKGLNTTTILRQLICLTILAPFSVSGAQVTQEFILDLNFNHNGSESYRGSVTESASFMLFDSTHGFLDSVVFSTINSSGAHSTSVRNIGELDSRIYLAPAVTLYWTPLPNMRERLIQGFKNSGSSRYPSPNTLEWDYISSGSNIGGGRTDIFSGSDAANFIGISEYDFMPRWHVNVYSNAESGTEYKVEMSYRGSYEVTYNYTPYVIPIPSAAWLFISGLMFLVSIKHIRVSK